mgnify:FL=1|jgi:large subunit ribosomal protein L17
MRHKISGRKLNRPTAHRMHMLRGMVKDLVRYESIKTTEPKAKEVRRMAEKFITRGKEGSLHSRRLTLGLLSDDAVVNKLFDELAERYQDRHGGYTRVIKLGPRKGDAAPMAVVELVS